MEYVIVNPSSIHEVCGLLGFVSASGEYHVKKETCADALEELLAKLGNDGPSLRMRRSLGLSQVVSRDLIPLLKSAAVECPKMVPQIVKLLSNMTTPVECLVPANFALTDEGQQVVYELNSILKGIKMEFMDYAATKAIVEDLKSIYTRTENLTSDECVRVSDGLLLLRNILHIPHKDTQVQNQILWNLFAHSLDKMLLHLMTCEQKNLWGIPLVQLIALIYKDQHVTNLQKLLNFWLENCLSESSEDNESNTSLAVGSGCDSCSPIVTSDPTSDSDNGARGICKKTLRSNFSSVTIQPEGFVKSPSDVTSISSQSSSADLGSSSHSLLSPSAKTSEDNLKSGESSRNSVTGDSEPDSTPPAEVSCMNTNNSHSYSSSQNQKCYTKAKPKSKAKMTMSLTLKERLSDADSGVSSMMSSSHFLNDITHTSADESEGNRVQLRSSVVMSAKIESYKQKQESTSTSSNDDDLALRKLRPILKLRERASKMSNRANSLQKSRSPLVMTSQDKKEIRRKKLHKRAKRAKPTMKAFVHHNPTEEDISHILREFTVDFLLKGYASLVSMLQEQLSVNSAFQNQIDKSHFLWLITYFLKFASQLELDFEHISPVLSYKTLSYLTFEGAAMCENLINCKDDPKPHMSRMHLVVTAIREFVQAVEIYSKIPSYSHEVKALLYQLQRDILNVEELRYLFLLLIRQFRQGVQSKQYLQDLIITNHVLLMFMEKISSSPDYSGDFVMVDYIKEFSSPLIMQQYGHLLEDFKKNGEFVNDCVFTMMHHIAGDLTCPEALFQPLILKTFSSIWEAEFEIRDDWADLIEYVIQRFMRANNDEQKSIFKFRTSNTSNVSGWTKQDIEKLHWLYTKFSQSVDPIAKILEAYGGISIGKNFDSVLNELLHQRIIGYNKFIQFLASKRISSTKRHEVSSSESTSGSPATPFCLIDQLRSANNLYSFETAENTNMVNMTHSSHSNMIKSSRLMAITIPTNLKRSEISFEELLNQIKSDGQDIKWLQRKILEACYVKLTIEQKNESRFSQRKRPESYAVSKDNEPSCFSKRKMEPIPYHYSLLGQSIPLVPWTYRQEVLLSSPPYMLLLHKLGFHMPADVGKLYPRIPHFWNSEVLLSVARKLGPIPSKTHMKFDPARVLRVSDCEDEPPSKIPCFSLGIPTVEEPLYALPKAGVGVGVGNSFIQGHGSYGCHSAAHSINWMTLVHKSKQLIERHSEAITSSLDTDSDSTEKCDSLKNVSLTDHSLSKDVTMRFDESGHEESDAAGEFDDDEYNSDL